MKAKKNLNRKTVRLLRKVQKFLLDEPRRFNMLDGVQTATAVNIKVEENISNLYYPESSRRFKSMLAQPPCGTACCIAGAAYVIDKNISLNSTSVSWLFIEDYISHNYPNLPDKLFYVEFVHINVRAGENAWPEFYGRMYRDAKTPLERAIAGVARIEHFIQTDGQE